MHFYMIAFLTTLTQIFPLPERGQCFTFGSNQHGQIGCSSRRSSRVPYLVPGLQGITMAACGDAFTLAIGSGEKNVQTPCLDPAHFHRWFGVF